jgi:hypothetical protein
VEDRDPRLITSATLMSISRPLLRRGRNALRPGLGRLGLAAFGVRVLRWEGLRLRLSVLRPRRRRASTAAAVFLTRLWGTGCADGPAAQPRAPRGPGSPRGRSRSHPVAANGVLVQRCRRRRIDGSAARAASVCCAGWPSGWPWRRRRPRPRRSACASDLAGRLRVPCQGSTQRRHARAVALRRSIALAAVSTGATAGGAASFSAAAQFHRRGGAPAGSPRGGILGEIDGASEAGGAFVAAVPADRLDFPVVELDSPAGNPAAALCPGGTRAGCAQAAFPMMMNDALRSCL